MVGRTTNFPTDGRWSLRKVRDEVANDSWVGPPNAASSVSGSATGDTTATVTYTASSGATSYKVYYSTSSGVDTSDSVVSGNSTTANITGLSANTQYYFAWNAVALPAMLLQAAVTCKTLCSASSWKVHSPDGEKLRACWTCERTPEPAQALLVASAAHDMGHPGVTNDFLVPSLSHYCMAFQELSRVQNF